MRIAGIQISSGPDAEKNVARAAEMAEIAVEKGASLIGFPELFHAPWFPKEEDRAHFALAGDLSGNVFERLLKISDDAKVVMIIPFFESSGGKYYNSAAVVDQGAIIGTYRKMHLPNLPLYREQFYFTAGDGGFPVFTTSQGVIGIQICWDNLFPEGARILALKGAEIIFAPTAASQDTHTVWEKTITANAFANNFFIFRVNRAGQENGINFYGRSFCAGPWGEMVSEQAGSKETIVLADIDRREREHAIEAWGFLHHRRPAEYGELLR